MASAFVPLSLCATSSMEARFGSIRTLFPHGAAGHYGHRSACMSADLVAHRMGHGGLCSLPQVVCLLLTDIPQVACHLAVRWPDEAGRSSVSGPRWSARSRLRFGEASPHRMPLPARWRPNHGSAPTTPMNQDGDRRQSRFADSCTSADRQVTLLCAPLGKGRTSVCCKVDPDVEGVVRTTEKKIITNSAPSR